MPSKITASGDIGLKRIDRSGTLTIISKIVCEDKNVENSPILYKSFTRPKSQSIHDCPSPRNKIRIDLEIAQQKSIHHKDSKLESESPNSEEDLLDVSKELTLSTFHPVSVMTYSKPNAKSQGRDLEEKEYSSGIPSSKR